MPPTGSEFRSLYIHVPFCRHRCGYCDFTLVAGRDDLISPYLRALAREFDLRGHLPQHPAMSVDDDDRPLLETVFLGGGTPTHLPPRELQQFFQLVWGRFRLAENAEVSVEANPLDLTEDRLAVLHKAGVNRLSLGVQSLDTETLQLLERDHQPTDIAKIVARARNMGFTNISLDLIFGVPGQSLAVWEQTVQQALELEPTHLSTYGLTFEANTHFEVRRKRGELQPMDDGQERDMYALAMDRIESAGLAQYEISSFAQPGFECRHNEVYWCGDSYEAVGPGAARYIDGVRETNLRNVTGWLSRLNDGGSPVGEAEELGRKERAHELIFLNLRRVRGIDRADFQRRTGESLDRLVGPEIRKFIVDGLLEDDGVNVRLTRAGRFLADHVIAELL